MASTKIIHNLTVREDFTDGTLNEAFKVLGYPAKWKAGERRDLPFEVAQRVVTSGGVLGIQDPTAPESKITEGAEPVQIDLNEYYEKLYGKGKRVRVVFPEGFRDGNFTSELAAVGHPAEIGPGEILELPMTLIEKIAASGGLYSTDPEVIQQTSGIQGKYQLRVRQWQAEREAEKQRIADGRARAEQNQKTLAEIEQLSGEYLSATGKAKEAIWERIRELRLSIQ